MKNLSINEFFDKNGYYVEKQVFTNNDMKPLFETLYDLSWSCASNNNINMSHKLPHPSAIKFPRDLKQLDYIMLDIFKYNKDFIGEIYDAFSYSFNFMRFLGNDKVEQITKQLLGLPDYTTLYSWEHRVRIDLPLDERRTYGWHQEIFYTIPESRFLQTWCPILRDTTIENGTIEIKPKSHMEGITKQTWTEEDSKATQIIIDKSVLEKYKTIQLEMKLGDILFFDGHLAHRSGHNTTNDEIRFSLVGMWNDTNYKSFRAPRPNFQLRSISAKEYFKSLLKD